MRTENRWLAVVLTAMFAASCLPGCEGGEDKCFDKKSEEVDCKEHCRPSGVEHQGFDDNNPYPCGDVTCDPGKYCCNCD